MFPHKQSSVGRKSDQNSHQQQQVEVHNFSKHSNILNNFTNNNNNNSSRKSSGYGGNLLGNNGKSSQYLESQFDSSQFLKTNPFNRNDDEDVKYCGNPTFNHHFPELVTGCSPTFDERPSSTPIHDKIALSHQNKVNDKIELHQFDVSPRRLKAEFDEKNTSNFIQKRPGFPQRIQMQLKPPTSNDETPQPRTYSEDQDNIDEFYDFDKKFFSPFQQQELQQQKLLEFQQQSKLQQVEKVLPLDKLDFESPQRSTMIPYSQLQRLVALKKIQQKHHYEHILQQHYENRNIIEEAYANDNFKSDDYDESTTIEDDLEKLNYYTNVQAKKFTMSPDATDYDSNGGDDSDFSLKFIRSDLSLSTNNLTTGGGGGATEHSSKLDNCMPTLEDGLSDNESSFPDINYNVTTRNKTGTSAHHQLESHHSKRSLTTNRELSSIDLNINNLHLSNESISDERNLSQDTESELITNNQNEITSEVSNLSPSLLYEEEQASENPISPANVGKSPTKRDEEEPDTDNETDRLLGQQRVNELYGKLENKTKKVRCAGGQMITSPSLNITKTPCTIRHGVGTYTIPSASHEQSASVTDDDEEVIALKSPSKYSKSPTGSVQSYQAESKDVFKLEPQVLIEGVLFRARYLGSTQLICEGQPTKTTRMMQAEEAVARIKAPEGESQPSTEVDLFISIEKIMVLNTDLKEIMMDHSLKTISYIADIGSLVVLMARRRHPPQEHSSSSSSENNNQEKPLETSRKSTKGSKMICHVFESDEAQFIAQSIGQAFQVAYMEFLKANGIEDHSFMKEMDYQEVLSSQSIFGDELEVFAKKELQKEVVVPKTKGEILGVMIVESGWGSMLPTVVIANLAPNGAAARCGHLNIGDQIIAINGLSLVGLPLTQCQNYIKNTKNQTAVKFTVVPCAPVVEVKIKRPNTKYQLGFSVQNGVICSLLRGGIAERGGVRVGHRIIEINNQSVVAVPHEKIVNLLATSVGEIMMKTMPTSMFRLLTGQENPFFI